MGWSFLKRCNQDEQHLKLRIEERQNHQKSEESQEQNQFRVQITAEDSRHVRFRSTKRERLLRFVNLTIRTVQLDLLCFFKWADLARFIQKGFWGAGFLGCRGVSRRAKVNVLSSLVDSLTSKWKCGLQIYHLTITRKLAIPQAHVRNVRVRVVD